MLLPAVGVPKGLLLAGEAASKDVLVAPADAPKPEAELPAVNGLVP